METTNSEPIIGPVPAHAVRRNPSFKKLLKLPMSWGSGTVKFWCSLSIVYS